LEAQGSEDVDAVVVVAVAVVVVEKPPLLTQKL
jgi:hypothetical protein